MGEGLALRDANHAREEQDEEKHEEREPPAQQSRVRIRVRKYSETRDEHPDKADQCHRGTQRGVFEILLHIKLYGQTTVLNIYIEPRRNLVIRSVFLRRIRSYLQREMHTVPRLSQHEQVVKERI